MQSDQPASKRLQDNEDTGPSKKRRKREVAHDMSKNRGSAFFAGALQFIRSLFKRDNLEFYPPPAPKVPSSFRRIVYIMRGPPCCGKSTAARSLLTEHFKLGGLVSRADNKNASALISRAFILSTDDYFTYVDEDGNAEYTFNPKHIGSNHERNQRRCETAMELGITPLFVDNTNIALWEMRAYVLLADRFGYEIEVVDPHQLSPYAFDVDTLVRRSEAGQGRASGKVIPRNVFQRMVRNFESLPTDSASSDPLDEVRAATGPERRKELPPPPRYAGLDVEPQLLASLGAVELGQAFWGALHGGQGNYSAARGLQDICGAFGVDSPPGPFNIPARLHVTVSFFGIADGGSAHSLAQDLVGVEYTVTISSLIFVRGGGLLCAPCTISDRHGETPMELQNLASSTWRPHVTLLTAKGGEWRPVDSTAVLAAWEDAVLRKVTNACKNSTACIIASESTTMDRGPECEAPTADNQATGTVDWKKYGEQADILWNIYETDYAFPPWSKDRLASGELEEYARTTVVYYSREDDLTKVQRLATERDPVNLAMQRYYKVVELKEKHDYEHGAYSLSTEDLLMPNIAIYTKTPITDGRQFASFHVINAIGIAFDTPLQPDYRYFFKEDGASKEIAGMSSVKWEELVQRMSLMWCYIFECAKQHSLKHVYLASVGGGLLKGPLTDNQYEELKQQSLNVVLASHPGIECHPLPTIPDWCFSEEGKKRCEDSLLVNAWNPWSIVGNANAADNSLDGFFGRCSALAVLCWPRTNPLLQYIPIDPSPTKVPVRANVEEDTVVEACVDPYLLVASNEDTGEPISQEEVQSELGVVEEIVVDQLAALGSPRCASGESSIVSREPREMLPTGASDVEIFSDVRVLDTVVDLCAIHLPSPVELPACSFRLFWK